MNHHVVHGFLFEFIVILSSFAHGLLLTVELHYLVSPEKFQIWLESIIKAYAKLVR